MRHNFSAAAPDLRRGRFCGRCLGYENDLPADGECRPPFAKPSESPAATWNRLHVIGTPVVVTKDNGDKFHTKTRSEAWPLGHGDTVVMVDGISGGYLLDRVVAEPNHSFSQLADQRRGRFCHWCEKYETEIATGAICLSPFVAPTKSLHFDAAAAWNDLSPEDRRAVGEAALLIGGSMAFAVANFHDLPTSDAARRWGHAAEVALEIIGSRLPDLAGYPEGPDLNQLGIPACRRCGCTENSACTPACSWVEPDLCSACVVPMEATNGE